MSTESQPSEEYGIFRAHYARLVHAIQDPLLLSIQLFSKGIISSVLKENMSVMGVSRLVKNNELLSAVEMQIQTDPNTFYVFLSALNEDPAIQSLVGSMKSKCSTICKAIIVR